MKTPKYLLELETGEARALGHAIVDRLLAYQAQLANCPLCALNRREICAQLYGNRCQKVREIRSPCSIA